MADIPTLPEAKLNIIYRTSGPDEPRMLLDCTVLIDGEEVARLPICSLTTEATVQAPAEADIKLYTHHLTEEIRTP